jgi:restriction endonuclease Mrr
MAGGLRHPKLLIVLGVFLAIVVVTVPGPVRLAIVVVGLLAATVPLLARGRDRRARVEESRKRTEAAMMAARTDQARLDRAFATTGGMTGPEFELLVGRLLERDGCQDVRVSGGAGDRGADLTAISPYGHRVVVQCKRYGARHPVGDPEIQRFLGTVYHEHRAEVALFVTTSHYTTSARELGTRRGIVLVDGGRLAAWMSGGHSPLPLDPAEETS